MKRILTILLLAVVAFPAFAQMGSPIIIPIWPDGAPNDNGIVTEEEKLLVDIRCDADFDYRGGGEAFRMLENAVSLYMVNRTKLLRYAGRRHCREEFENDLDQLGL